MTAPDATLLHAADPALGSSDDLARARAVVASAVIDAGAEEHRRTILDFVDDHPDALHRSNTSGHLTGSGLVLDPTGTKVVLLFHRKLQRWLQPGGHCDGDANLAAVALREALEETGLPGLRIWPEPVDVDVHEVDPPAEGPHLHLDVRFLVVAPDASPPPGNHESTRVEWVDVDRLDSYGLDVGTMRMLNRGRRVLSELTGA